MLGILPLPLQLLAPAHAADVVSGANLSAMGGVGAAASRDNAAITVNPGLLALHPRYDFMGMFRYGPDPGPGSPADLGWGFTAMDARTSDVVALGLSYSGDRYEPVLAERDLPGWTIPGAEIPNDKRFHDFAGALSLAAFQRRLGLGLGVNVTYFDHERQGNGVLFDLHAGIGARPVDWLVIGAAARNVVPGRGENRPFGVVGGVRVESERLLAVEVNAEWRDVYTVGLPVTLATGFEARPGTARIRVGWRRDASDGVHFATAGIGADKDGAGVEYGIAIPLDHPRFASTVHTVSIRFGAPAPIEPEY